LPALGVLPALLIPAAATAGGVYLIDLWRQSQRSGFPPPPPPVAPPVPTGGDRGAVTDPRAVDRIIAEAHRATIERWREFYEQVDRANNPPPPNTPDDNTLLWLALAAAAVAAYFVVKS